MSAPSAIPSWVQKSKQKAQKSQEWISFSKVLYDNVSLRMQENGIRSFNMLSLEEKKVLVSKAVTMLNGGSAYQNLFTVMSRALDEELSAKIKASEAGGSKPKLYSQECRKANEAILHEWPDASVYFLQCLNTSLSVEMRHMLWKTQLQDSFVRQEYLKLVKSSPKSLLSKLDLEISQKCQRILQSDPTFKVLHETKTSSSVLRHLLSYYHVRSRSVVGLTEAEYLVAVLFVYSTLCPVLKANQSDKSASLSVEAIATLVEEFIVFWDNRPDYTKSHSQSIDKFAEEVVRLLRKLDNGLANVLEDLHSKRIRSVENAGQSAVADLFMPYIRSFFVSYLPLDTVMFIFDQIIIGHHVAAFDPMPYVCASLLFLHENEIRSCQSWTALESKFRGLLSKQNVASLQGLFMEVKYNEELIETLEADLRRSGRFHMSSIASIEKLPPWRHWYSDKLAAQFQMVRAKGVSKASSLSTLLSPDRESTHESGETARLNELESERDSLIDEVNLMKHELVEARKEIRVKTRETEEVKEQADDEIERLMRQVLYLQRKNTLTPPPLQIASRFGLSEPQYEDSEISGVGSAPPPTEAADAKISPTPTQMSSSSNKTEEEPLVEQPQPLKVDAAAVTHDLIARMMQGFNLIAHGSGQEQVVLNSQTKSDLDAVKNAYELAKVQVFKKPTSDEDIEKLPEEARRRVSKQLSEATRSQLLKLKVAKP